MTAFRFKETVAIAALLLSAGGAFADTSCGAEVGSTINLTDLDPLLEKISSLQKDEFESTEDFKERVEREFAPANSQPIFLQTAHDENSAFYDADRAAWYFTEYFGSNSVWNFDRQAIEESGLENAGLFASKMLFAEDEVVGTHIAQNAMGAKLDISEIIATRVGVIEIAGDFPTGSYPSHPGMFDLPDSISYTPEGMTHEFTNPALPLPMPPAEARSMKGNFKFAVQLVPVEPYVLNHEHYMSARFDNPREATINSTFIVSDIQCGIITDRNDVVLAIMPMASPF